MPTEERPCHLILRPGEIVTLCGLDVRTKAGKPYMVARHLPAHRAGHVSVGKTKLVCVECERAATESGAT